MVSREMMGVDLDRRMKGMCGIARGENVQHRWFFVDEDPLSEKRENDLGCDWNVTRRTYMESRRITSR